MGSRRATMTALAVVGLLVACSPSGQVGSQVTQPTATEDAPSDTSFDTVPDSTDETVPDTTEAPSVPALTSLDWYGCSAPVAVGPVECATIRVPLDHDDPEGEHIPLALVRVPATGKRIGAILFNPGGPGASGFDYIASSGSSISSLMGLQQFDLIGFDPRGVGRSNGLRCLSDDEMDAAAYQDETPENDTERAIIESTRQHFADACVTKYGDTLRYYSTDETARDMDTIRAALGDEQISYLGVSYGTYLGATYATLFPDRVRAMVLDAAYEPTGDTVEQRYTTNLIGFEHAFEHWATWCEGTDQCAFRSADVAADWDALADQLDDSPVVGSSGRTANQTVMQYATIAAMYSEAAWPRLADALAAVRGGDPTDLFAMADAYIGREPDGTFSTISQSNTIINCASGISAPLPPDPAALVATLHAVAPHFSRNVEVDDIVDSCAPLMPAVTPRTLDYTGDGPIVVVGGTNDPATPIRWAQEMTELMGDHATLVTYTGEGHGALETSLCATQIEAALLVTLTTPDDGTVCAPDPVVERPSWWDGLPLPAGVGPVVEDPQVAGVLGIGPTVAYTELRTSTLTPSTAIDAYDAALEAAGWERGERQEPFEGVEQGVYFDPAGRVFSAIAVGPEAFADLQLEGLTELLPPGETLIVLLAPRTT